MEQNRTTEARGETVYEEYRPLLFSIAYRMVGSASDAEDIVQEAFLRLHRETSKGADIDSPKAWLSTVTTRLSINHVQSARVRRESYVGTWLPEPLLTDGEPEGVRNAETADSLSLAFLVLLETLGPVERAVFLLREVFDYGYDEIAPVVGRSEENCRQIAVRARRQVETKKPRFEASRKKREELSRRFFAAIAQGDTEGLIGLLAADVIAYGDGGGKAPAFRRPVYGREKVVRLSLNFGRLAERVRVTDIRHVEVNGQPGAILMNPEGRPMVVVSLDIADGLVQTVRAVSNPDKLRHLDSHADRG